MCVNIVQEIELAKSAIFVKIDLLANTVTVTYMMDVAGKKGDLGGFFFFPGVEEYQMMASPTVRETKRFQTRLAQYFAPPVTRGAKGVSFGMDLRSSSQEIYFDGVIVKANSTAALADEISNGSIDSRFVDIFPNGGNKVVQTVSNMETLCNKPVTGRMYEMQDHEGVVMTTYQYKFTGGKCVIPFYENDHRDVSKIPVNAERQTLVVVGFSAGMEGEEFFPINDTRFYLKGYNGANGNLQIDASSLMHNLMRMENPHELLKSQQAHFAIVD
jgi:hypothetical protein